MVSKVFLQKCATCRQSSILSLFSILNSHIHSPLKRILLPSTHFLQPSPPRISNASSLGITSLLMPHVSYPYSTSAHTGILTILFLRALIILLDSSSLRLLNAFLEHTIRCFISSTHLPSSAITDHKYLNFLTCSTLCPSTTILTVPLPFLATILVLVFLTLSFML